MSCLITGATGFIGGHLVQRLLQEGFTVYAIVRHSPRVAVLPREINTIYGDVTDIHSLRKAVKESQPEYVFHLSAMTPVRLSFFNPFLYYNTNLLGTMNMVHAVLDEAPTLKRFIMASTAEVYKPKDGLITEDDELYGSTVYGISKVAADNYVRIAGQNFGLIYTTLRPSNTFGRLTERGYLTEKVITQMLEGESVVLHGPPHIVRSFIHVDDHVDAYLRVFDEPKAENEVFNVSSGKRTSIKEMVETCARLLDWKGEVMYGVRPRPYDPPRLVLSGEKMRTVLGWKPKLSLEEGLKKVIQFWSERL